MSSATPNKKTKAQAKAAAPSVPSSEPERGSGKFYYRSGATYEGEWIFDANAELSMPSQTSEASSTLVPSSQPSEKPKGVRYKDGKGVYKDGEYSYEGEWARDLANGEGTFRFASGAIYTGQWRMGAYCGSGTYKWPDGRSYTGEWRDNKMHGNGIYTDKDGHKWTGQFFNGNGPGLTPQL
ncbi:hypothetical protein KP509_28G019400 [Ceratopteris richardii]|uniref:Uncharacterized protein n=1 Tax=Ceratopteris richardii TaxID=49495 RepID=A0A8T2RBD7_CERRI|nr:hypothetical protein KP509_28G019400 [Ceratopteris richardii]